jgi:hypothetical protein
MVSLAFGASNHGLVRCRFDHDRLLHQAVEQLASISGSPSIEAEGELIERKLQVLMAHRPLVRAQYPPVQQRYDQVDMRQQFRRGLWLAFYHGHLMDVTLRCHCRIALPSVSMDGAPRFNRFLQQSRQADAGGVRNPFHANPPYARAIFLHSDNYQRLTLRLAAAHTLFQSPRQVSSTCTRPLRRSRPGRTIARRNLCSHVQAVL